MSKLPEVVKFVFASGVVFCFGLLFWSVSDRYDSVPYIGEQNPTINSIVTKKQPLRTQFLASNEKIVGIDIFSNDEAITKLPLQLDISDETGKIVGTTLERSYFYQNNYSHTVTVRIKTTTVPEKPGTKLWLELTLVGSQSTTLLMNESEEDKANKKPELIFSLLHPLPVSSETHRGVLVGVAFALALLTLHFLSGAISSRMKWVMVTILVIFLAVLISTPYIYRSGWGIDDWDYRYSLGHIYRTTVLSFGQLPLWNPFICGGTAGLGDPEFSLFTPYFLLQLIFGVEKGTGLAITLCFIVTGLGMIFLAKKLKFSPYAALTAAMVILLSSALPLKTSEGHTTIIFAFMWVPWIFASWLSAYRLCLTDKKKAVLWTLVCGIFLAMALLHGGIYILSYTALAILLISVLLPFKKNALLTTFFVGCWIIGLAAFQLIPTLFWLKQFPDTTFVSSASTWQNWHDIFFGRHMQGAFPIRNQLSKWHEYGAYIGYGVLALSLLGLTYFKKRQLARVLFGGVILTLLFSSLGPVLVPILDHLSFLPRSNISRLVLYTILCVGLLSGLGVDRLRKVFGDKTYFIPILIAIICLDLASLSYPITAQGFIVPPALSPGFLVKAPIAFTANAQDIRIQGVDIPRGYAAIKHGYGTFSFCSVIGPTSAVEIATSDNSIPAYLNAEDGVDVSLVAWSPNKITIKVSSDKPTRITLNNNNAHGWHSSFGVIEREAKTLNLIIPTDVKDRLITLSYRPDGVLVGVLITIISLLCATWLVIKYYF